MSVTTPEQRQRLENAGFVRCIDKENGWCERWEFGLCLFFLRVNEVRGELAWGVHGLFATDSVHMAFRNALYPPIEVEPVTEEERQALLPGRPGPHGTAGPNEL